LVVAGWLCVAAGLASEAQAQPPTQATVDSLRAELARMQVQLDSLMRLIESGAAPAVQAEADSAADALAAVRAAAAAALADTVAQPAAQVAEGQFVGRQRNLNVFNPEISVTGDVFAFVNSEDPDADNFVPREFELALQSNLDPFSRAKIFVAHHRHGGEISPFAHGHDGEGGEEAEDAHGDEAETEIEEGYVEWVGLPAGLGLTIGKFRQRFGKLNRWHPHALPAQQLPLPYRVHFGDDGLSQAGASVHWLLPIHGAGTYELWTQVTRSGNETLFGESNGISALGHLNGFWQLTPATYFELGLSATTGRHREAEEAFDVRLYGVDFTLDWTPPATSKYRQATLHGGVVLGRRAFDDGPDADAFGAFAIGEYKFAQQWIAGARYEYTENPAEPDEDAWLIAPSLTWWQSEFVRIRAEYEFVSAIGELFGQFVLQTTFAMGPHKHETY